MTISKRKAKFVAKNEQIRLFAKRNDWSMGPSDPFDERLHEVTLPGFRESLRAPRWSYARR